jgi:hypothetical protein
MTNSGGGPGQGRQVSDDGKWWWDGSQWQPTDESQQAPPGPPQGTSQQQHGYQQQPPPGYQQQQPPKKKHTVRNVLLILVLLLVLFIGGCIALIGGAVNEVDKAIEEEEANDRPVAVSEGEGFERDDFTVDDGWQVTSEEFEGTNITDLRVTNDAEDAARTAMFTFTFYSGNENLGSVECSSNEMQSGESSQMDCTSFGETIEGYDSIKVADMF